jgi:hypothetical protein
MKNISIGQVYKSLKKK